LRQVGIVGIEDGEILASGAPQALVDRDVAPRFSRASKVTVVRGRRRAGEELLNDLNAAVGGAVVNDDQLARRQGLREDRLDRSTTNARWL